MMDIDAQANAFLKDPRISAWLDAVGRTGSNRDAVEALISDVYKIGLIDGLSGSKTNNSGTIEDDIEELKRLCRLD